MAWNGTNPETEKILKEFDCKIVPYVWKDDFADARKVSFSQTTNDLVLWLDADDTVENAQKIPDLLTAFNDPRIGSVWLPYNYDQDEYGQCVMLLCRERIVRKAWWEWKGKIHEVMVPKRSCAHVREDSVVVKHTVLKERVQNSAARNLKISQKTYNDEKEAGNLDPRTIYDYARSLKAGGLRKEALEIFKEFIEKSTFDDDRYEALHSIAEIYRKFRWFDAALDAENQAVKLRPRRAEAYFGLAETYYCMDDMDNVIWYTELGYKCPPREDNMPIDPIALKAKPLFPLHFALISKARWEEALQVAQKALQFFPKNQLMLNAVKECESRIQQDKVERACLTVYEHLSLDGESHKLKDFSKVIPDIAKDHPVFTRLINKHREKDEWSNKIVIYCGSSWELWDPKCVGEGIGGSEEAVINMAPLLAKMGWQVEVYNNCLEEGNYDGATWKPFWTYDQSQKCAVFIAWRDSRSVLLAPEGAYVCAWLHDKQKSEHWSQEMIDRTDKFFFLSEYHRQDLPEIPDEKVFITANGIITSQFIVPEARDPKRCIYASSPDRGLDILLQNWAGIREQVPDAELHVFYGFSKTYDELHKNNQAMKEFKDTCLKLMEQPGITYHGRVGHEQLAKEFLKSSVWVYPTYFTEISCITAMKAQAAGAIPVTTTMAALNETVQHGYKISFSIYDKRTQLSFVQIVADLLNNPDKQEKIRKPMMKWAHQKLSWKSVAESWDSLFRARILQIA